MTGVILLMAEPRTSHRLTTGRISRSCVFLTTPRARGTAATYNQHIFMSRGQTPLYWMANHTLSPSTLHTACPSSFSLLSFFILFFFLLRSGSEMEEEGGGQRQRERWTGEITRPPWAPRRARERCLLSQFANRGAHRSSPRGSFVHILRFFEVKLTRRLPLIGRAFLFRRCLSDTRPLLLPPNDPENSWNWRIVWRESSREIDVCGRSKDYFISLYVSKKLESRLEELLLFFFF